MWLVPGVKLFIQWIREVGQWSGLGCVVFVLVDGIGIRDFPDHATSREKSVTTGLVGQAWGFPLFDTV